MCIRSRLGGNRLRAIPLSFLHSNMLYIVNSFYSSVTISPLPTIIDKSLGDRSISYIQTPSILTYLFTYNNVTVVYRDTAGPFKSTISLASLFVSYSSLLPICSRGYLPEAEIKSFFFFFFPPYVFSSLNPIPPLSSLISSFSFFFR